MTKSKMFQCFAEAMFDNESEWPDELAFKRGEMMRVHERSLDDGLTDGWCLCTDRVGRRGIVPTNRLKFVPGPPSTMLMQDEPLSQMIHSTNPQSELRRLSTENSHKTANHHHNNNDQRFSSSIADEMYNNFNRPHNNLGSSHLNGRMGGDNSLKSRLFNDDTDSFFGNHHNPLSNGRSLSHAGNHNLRTAGGGTYFGGNSAASQSALFHPPQHRAGSIDFAPLSDQRLFGENTSFAPALGTGLSATSLRSNLNNQHLQLQQKQQQMHRTNTDSPNSVIRNIPIRVINEGKSSSPTPPPVPPPPAEDHFQRTSNNELEKGPIYHPQVGKGRSNPDNMVNNKQTVSANPAATKSAPQPPQRRYFNVMPGNTTDSVDYQSRRERVMQVDDVKWKSFMDATMPPEFQQPHSKDEQPSAFLTPPSSSSEQPSSQSSGTASNRSSLNQESTPTATLTGGSSANSQADLTLVRNNRAASLLEQQQSTSVLMNSMQNLLDDAQYSAPLRVQTKQLRRSRDDLLHEQAPAPRSPAFPVHVPPTQEEKDELRQISNGAPPRDNQHKKNGSSSILRKSPSPPKNVTISEAKAEKSAKNNNKSNNSSSHFASLFSTIRSVTGRRATSQSPTTASIVSNEKTSNGSGSTITSDANQSIMSKSMIESKDSRFIINHNNASPNSDSHFSSQPVNQPPASQPTKYSNLDTIVSLSSEARPIPRSLPDQISRPVLVPSSTEGPELLSDRLTELLRRLDAYDQYLHKVAGQRNWRQPQVLQAYLGDVHKTVDDVADCLNQFVDLAHTSAEPATREFENLLYPLKNHRTIVTHLCQMLNATGWSLASLSRQTPEHAQTDVLDQFLSVAGQIPGDCQKVVGYVRERMPLRTVLAANQPDNAASHPVSKPSVSSNIANRQSSANKQHETASAPVKYPQPQQQQAAPQVHVPRIVVQDDKEETMHKPSNTVVYPTSGPSTIIEEDQLMSDAESLFDDYDFVDGPSSRPPHHQQAPKGFVPPQTITTSNYKNFNMANQSSDSADSGRVPVVQPNTNAVVTAPEPPTRHVANMSVTASAPKAPQRSINSQSAASAGARDRPEANSTDNDSDDLNLLRYYQPQMMQHMTYLSAAIEDFFTSVEQRRAPMDFITKSKLVVLAAHKMVYIGDSVSQVLHDSFIGGRLRQQSDQLCATLKVSVQQTKLAAENYPDVRHVQAMVDSMVDVSHAAHQLKLAVNRYAQG